MVHLSCPVCPHGFLADVRELQQRISSVLTRSLYCPICSEILIGLPALDAHLAQHLPYHQGFTSSSIRSTNLIESLSPSNLIQDFFQSKDREPGNSSPDGRPHGTLSGMRIMGVEAIPSLEKLEISDDKLTAELTRSLSTMDGNSNSPASPKLVYMQNLSRTSSRCSVPGDEVRPNREWSAPPSVEQHSCDTCGLVFSSEHFLQLHMDVMHKHSDCFEVSCKICKAKFGDLESYRNHVRESHRERRYLCEECPKTFKLRGSLVVHKRMYHNGSPSACQICNKKFPSHTRKEFHERRYHATGSKSIFKGKSVLHGPLSSLHDLTRHDTETQSCLRSIQDAKHSLENLMEQTRLGKEASHSNIIQTLHPPSNSSISMSATDKCDVQVMSHAVPLQLEKASNTSDSFVSNIGPSFRQSQLRESLQAVTTLGDPNIVVRMDAELNLSGALKPSTNVRPSSDNHGESIISAVNNNPDINNRQGEIQQINDKQKMNKLEQQTQSPLQNLAPQFSISVPSNIGGFENEEGSLSNFLLARQMSCANNSKYFDILQQLNRNSPNTCLSILTSSTNSIEGSERQNFPFPQSLIRNKTSRSIITSVPGETEARLDKNIENIIVGNALEQQTIDALGHLQQESRQVGGEKDGSMCEGVVPVEEDAATSFAKPVIPEETVSRGSKENKGETSPAGAGDSKQWQCDVCKKNFTTKYFLKKHKRLHTGETPYCCGECGKTFTFQQSYHKHVLYHSDEKPHSCSYCGRSFKEMSTLHNHVRIHTGEKPFVCETCGKAFRQRVSYLVHLRIHTGALPYTCTECGKSFRYKVSLRSHKCENAPNNSNSGTPEHVPSPGNNSSTTTTLLEQPAAAGNAVSENLPRHNGASCSKMQAKADTKISTSDSFRVASQDDVCHLSTAEDLTGDVQQMDIDTEIEMSHPKRGSESFAQHTHPAQCSTPTNFIKPSYFATRSSTSAGDNGTSCASSSSSDLCIPPLTHGTPPLTHANTNNQTSSGWSIPFLAGKMNTTVKSSFLMDDPACNFVKQFNTILSGSQNLDRSNWVIDLLQGNEPESRTARRDDVRRNSADSKDIIRQETQVIEAVYPSQMETCAGVPMSFQTFSHVLNSKQHMQQQHEQQQHPSSIPYPQQPQQLQEQQSSELQHHYQSKDSHLHQNEQLQSQQRQLTSSESNILTLSPQGSDEETDLDPESFFKSLFT